MQAQEIRVVDVGVANIATWLTAFLIVDGVYIDEVVSNGRSSGLQRLSAYISWRNSRMVEKESTPSAAGKSRFVRFLMAAE